MKICTGVDLGDLIMDVEFKFEKCQGFLCHQGSKVHPFPLTMHVGLTRVQHGCERYKTASWSLWITNREVIGS